MSGGHFDYNQYRIHDIIVEIKEIILNCDDKENKLHDFSDETVKEFKNAVYYLMMAETYAQRIDWLVSGDDGEDSFHKRLKHEIMEIGKSPEKHQ